MAAAMAPQPHPATASLEVRAHGIVYLGTGTLYRSSTGTRSVCDKGGFQAVCNKGKPPLYQYLSIRVLKNLTQVFEYSSTYHLPKYCGMVKGAQAPQCTRRLITQASLGMRIPTPGGPNERITLRFSVRKQYLLVHSDSQGLVFPPLALFVYGCSPLSNSSGTL